MIRGMLEPGSGASSAAHQLSEPNSFCFLSSSSRERAMDLSRLNLMMASMREARAWLPVL
jgi:hypothetical protein